MYVIFIKEKIKSIMLYIHIILFFFHVFSIYVDSAICIHIYISLYEFFAIAKKEAKRKGAMTIVSGIE